MGDNIGFAYRSVNGIFLKRGINPPVDVFSQNLNVRDNLVRAMEFSKNGKFLAYCDSARTICVDTSDGKELFAHPFGKTARIMFSPDDKLMITYEPYVIYGSRIDEDGNTKKPNPNLRFYDTSNGTLLATLIQKNQSSWQPMFTDDGQTFVLIENSELHFYDSSAPERYTRKGVIRGIDTLKVSPGQDPLLAVFVPSKNEANIISLRNFHGELRSICQKTTFNADKCEFLWNTKGSACLAVTSVEVDQSNKSYYGVNSVFLLSKIGDNISVPLSKQGPVHDIKWSPTGSQFCVCHGFMPSKVVVFNLKASVIWDLGESHRNEIYYNVFGTILATCGFGNIASGKIQMWDVEKREEIVTMEVPNTTYFEWSPDGQHFLTATTSPRLRIDNNYRIWNYIGIDVYEQQMTERMNTPNGEEVKQIELAQVAFQPAPTVYPKFKICKLTPDEKRKLLEKKVPVEGHPVNSMRKAGVVSASSVYVPPALRAKGGSAATPNSSAPKQNSTNQNSNNQKNNSAPKVNDTPKAPAKEVNENEKKIKTLKKKINDCEALKQRKDKGEHLEGNQLAKIDKLDEMKVELEKLSLSA